MAKDSSLTWLDGFRVRPSGRAKHVRLKVVPPGRVEVVVPHGFDQRRLPGLLARHESWLARTVEKVRRDYGGAGPLLPPESIRLAAVDRHLPVGYRCTEGCRTRVDERGERLEVEYAEETAWREGLQGWLAEQGRTHLVPWLERVSHDVGLPYARVTIRSQKTRWGSCSARKHISLNCSLLFLPAPLVRYLFIHELCHTIHLNHSRRFWSLVQRLEPEYRRLDGELRLAARDVPAWARRD